MKSRWNDQDAKKFSEKARSNGQSELLGLRVYTSRLIGQDPDLVLHGGGNTSVKIDTPDGAVIHVKGSGWDLGDIEAPGLPAMHLSPLLEAREIAEMTDADMVSFLRSQLLDPSAPNPSVEALLHAFIPHAFVDHTHATSILALADQPDMEFVVDELFDGRVAFVPYVMPGYALSQECNRVYQANPDCEGLWLEQHGLFTFAETARASYEGMIAFVTKAEDYLASRGIIIPGPETGKMSEPAIQKDFEDAFNAISGWSEPVSIDFRQTPSILKMLSLSEIDKIARRGTATPDHVIRIKPFPLMIHDGDDAATIGRKLADFAEDYSAYFERNAQRSAEKKTKLDTLPRGVLVSGVGIFGLGQNQTSASVAADLWEQSARIILAAEKYGRFTPISEADLFDMEYWSLEQAKLKKT